MSSKGDNTITTTYTKKSDGTTTETKPSDGTTKFTTTKSVTLNGITWTAKIYDANEEQNTTTSSSSDNDNSITAANTNKVEITGTLPTGTTGGFKYKYTNTSNGNLDGNSQTLPSNITTIKIVLKKGNGGRRA